MNRRSHQRRNARLGFTLIEVMLVLVILAAIAGIAVLSLSGTQKSAYTKAAQAQINTIKNQLDMYKLNTGSYPEALDALHEQPTDMADPTRWTQVSRDAIKPDPWNHPFEYKVNGETYELLSLGPDGQSGTEDDIKG